MRLGLQIRKPHDKHVSANGELAGWRPRKRVCLATGCAAASDFYESATRSDFPAGVRPVLQVGQQMINMLPLVFG